MKRRTKMIDNTEDALFEFAVRRLIELRDAEIDRVILEGDGKERPNGMAVKENQK